MEKTPEVAGPTLPKYDPNKNYKWGPEDVFYLKGKDFGFILNVLRETITSPEAQRIYAAQKACRMLDASLMAAVEVGIAKEMEPEEMKKEPK